MKSAAEYRAYAAECRALATRFDYEQREQVLSMAEEWEALACAIEGALVSEIFKAAYDMIVQEPVPDRFLQLLEQLRAAEAKKRNGTNKPRRRGRGSVLRWR